RSLQLLTRLMKSRREDGRKLDVVLFARLNDRVASLERNLQRLFHDDMLAGVGGRDRRLHVSAAGCADRDNMDSSIGQHLVEVRVPAAPGLASELLHSRWNAIETSDELRAFQFANCLRVKPRDHSAADDAEAVGHD